MNAPAIQHNVSLAPFNTFGVAARARSYAEVRDIEQLRAALQSRQPTEPLLIPGTVGATPIQNIGAYGVEMKEVFQPKNGE